MQTQSSTPIVSIIMPAYNAALYLETAICSVVNQTMEDWELIVIDDCSTDDTPRIVAEFSRNDSRIDLITNEENIGVARTRNRGIELCRGKYIALLDSDDYWKPQMLEKMINRIEETKADITYCSYEIVGEQGEKVCNDFIVPITTSFEESIIRSVITCSTVLITAQLAKKHLFPTDIYHEDIALWFQLLRDGYIATGVTDILAAYRQRSDSRSAGKFLSAVRRWAIYRKHLNLPFWKSAITMIQYGIYGMKKYKKL